jgi:hypothetical protein
MSTGCQGTSLIQSPEVLQSKAQRKIAPCPMVWELAVRVYFIIGYHTEIDAMKE